MVLTNWCFTGTFLVLVIALVLFADSAVAWLESRNSPLKNFIAIGGGVRRPRDAFALVNLFKVAVVHALHVISRPAVIDGDPLRAVSHEPAIALFGIKEAAGAGVLIGRGGLRLERDDVVAVVAVAVAHGRLWRVVHFDNRQIRAGKGLRWKNNNFEFLESNYETEIYANYQFFTRFYEKFFASYLFIWKKVVFRFKYFKCY